jgi:hypothetical protein
MGAVSDSLVLGFVELRYSEVVPRAFVGNDAVYFFSTFAAIAS